MADKILQHIFFERVQQQGFTPALARSFAEQYELVSRHFPRFLALILSALDNEEVGTPILKNLWDEFGRGNRAAAHRRLIERFIAACRAREIIEIRPSAAARPETELYLRGLSALPLAETPALSLGALWFFEAVTPDEYQIIVEGLRAFGGFSDHDLGFFLDHISHDTAHLREIEAAFASSGYERTRFESGVVQARLLESVFWDGVVRGAVEVI